MTKPTEYMLQDFLGVATNGQLCQAIGLLTDVLGGRIEAVSDERLAEIEGEIDDLQEADIETDKRLQWMHRRVTNMENELQAIRDHMKRHPDDGPVP